MGQVGPFLSVFHHLAAACGVVFINGNLLADVLLGDSEGLFHTKLHGKTVGIPSGLAFHMEPFHCLVTAYDILDGTCHDMMYARHTVGRRGTFVENKRGTTLTLLHGTLEKHVLIPDAEHLFVDVRQIELSAIFLKFFHMLCFSFYRLDPLTPFVPLVPPPSAKIL